MCLYVYLKLAILRVGYIKFNNNCPFLKVYLNLSWNETFFLLVFLKNRWHSFSVMWKAEVSTQPSDGLQQKAELVWQLKTAHEETSGPLWQRERAQKALMVMGKTGRECDTMSSWDGKPRGWAQWVTPLPKAAVPSQAGKRSCAKVWHCCQENTQQNSFVWYKALLLSLSGFPLQNAFNPKI